MDSLEVTEAVSAEILKADQEHGPFKSVHEGYGVLAEKVAELLDAIRLNDYYAVEREAIQCAAVAHRIVESMDDEDCIKRSGCV